MSPAVDRSVISNTVVSYCIKIRGIAIKNLAGILDFGRLFIDFRHVFMHFRLS